jgi:hypothetical protein
MNARTMGWAAALAALGSLAWAGGPAGSGNLQWGAGWTPTFYSMGNQSGDAKAFDLKGDFPIWSGLQGQLDANLGLTHGESANSFADYENDGQNYGLNVALNLYPAAFAGIGFVPGEDANPDGWLLWPSAKIAYAANKFDDANTAAYFTGFPPHASWVYFQTDQVMQYGLTLPLATWLSLEGSYVRNLMVDSSQSNNAWNGERSGVYEGEGASATVYLNLAANAGADKSRPFLPHYGRLGQLALDLAWNRILYPGNNPQSSNNYSLTLGAPVSGCLSVALGASQTNVNMDYDRSYVAFLSWALGDPAGRTDR